MMLIKVLWHRERYIEAGAGWYAQPLQGYQKHPQEFGGIADLAKILDLAMVIVRGQGQM